MVIKKHKGAMLFLSMALFFSFTAWSDGSKIFRVIKEAENLTLLQDRLLACNTLFRAYKKSKGADAAQLKERLFYFSKNYYSDKGFQNFLLGKEFLEKEKYMEAVDKLTEADEFEKGNTEVLHHLSLAQMWVKKMKNAAENNQRALLINPLDDELIRDKLALEMASEAWTEALTTVAGLLAASGATSQDYYFKGVALFKINKPEEAKKALDIALNKDKNYAETYFYLSQIKSETEGGELQLKYNELCKIKKFNLRDPMLCSHMKEKSP